MIEELVVVEVETVIAEAAVEGRGVGRRPRDHHELLRVGPDQRVICPENLGIQDTVSHSRACGHRE